MYKRQAQGIVDIKGITERTPGFTMGTFNPGQPQFYIRGIGSNEDGAGGDQSVIVFVDEVYIGRSAGSDLTYLIWNASRSSADHRARSLAKMR